MMAIDVAYGRWLRSVDAGAVSGFRLGPVHEICWCGLRRGRRR